MVKEGRLLYCSIILFCIFNVVFTVETDLVIVLDKSGSIEQSDFNIAIDFLKDVVTALTIGTSDVQVSVVSFSDTSNEEFALNAHATRNDVLSALEGLKTSINTDGGTFTATALNYVQNTSFTAGKGGRGSANPVVVVMTDGLSQNLADTTAAANLIRSSISGSIIYAIGVGADLSSTTQELLNIASDPDDQNVMYVTAYTYICNMVPTLVTKIDSSASASVPTGCAQTTTTVFVGKGGGGGAATTTTTTTTPTTTTTTPTTTTTNPTTTTTTPTTTTTTTPTTTTTTPTTTTTTPATTTTTTPTITTTPTGTTTTPTTTTASQVAAAAGSSSSGSDLTSNEMTAVIATSTVGGFVAVTSITYWAFRRIQKKMANRVTKLSGTD